MRYRIKKLLLSAIPQRVKRMVISEIMGNIDINFDNVYFSQEGEDVILSKIYFSQQQGFYIDIGAHHPIKLSNTYKYYLSGWRGINIDAMPGSMALFREKRPRDINLEMGISNQAGVLPFYVFDQPALNTFDEATARKHCEDHQTSIKKIVEVETSRLEVILDRYLPPAQKIDFMSIDVEGLDLQVLQSNNWEKYKPDVILIESIDTTLEELLKSEMHLFLKERGYKAISKTFHTNIYKLGS